MLLKDALIPFQEEEAFIPVKQLLEVLADLNVLKIGAHPLRESTPWHHHDPSILKQFDAFDLNGKDLYTYEETMVQRVQKFAEKCHVPVIGGSDTHHMLQYGAICNVFPECTTIEELKGAIREQNYQVEISPQLDSKVSAAKQKKKEVKEALGV